MAEDGEVATAAAAAGAGKKVLLFAEDESGVEGFTQTLFESLVAATKASHRLPPPDDHRYYASFKAFKQRSAAAGSRLLSLTNRLLRLPQQEQQQQQQRGSSNARRSGAGATVQLLDPNGDAEVVSQQFDEVVDVIDGLLERIDSFADEVKGFKAEPKIVIAQARQSPHSRRGGGGQQQQQSFNVFMATNVVRPQLSFDDVPDNSNTPWLPRLTDKPHARLPLAPPQHPAAPSPAAAAAASTAGSGDGAGVVLSSELQQHMANLGMPLPTPGSLLEPRAEHPYLYEISRLELEPWMRSAPTEAEEPGELDSTPLEWIDTVEALERAAAELEEEAAVAVDLEHHSLRTFQGFTCLMQLSSRRKDYLLDTLRLRSHVGRCLRPLFANPSVVKVLHGADSDVVWLQRDFELYLVNLFDTGQAARTLPLERAGLAHALQHYCGVKANKQFQLADWRVRPLPAEMLKYAREDTHYLLYIYDRLRQDLVAASAADRDLMAQALARSRQVALKLYEKERFTPHSHLLLYNKSSSLSFNGEQLAALRAAYEWRDGLARLEDESSQFVLPNHQLLRIAADLPRTAAHLFACCRPAPPPLVKRDAADLLAAILRARAASSASAVLPQAAAAAAVLPGRPITVTADVDVPDAEDVDATTTDADAASHDAAAAQQQQQAATAAAVGTAFWAALDAAAGRVQPPPLDSSSAGSGWLPSGGVPGRTARLSAANIDAAGAARSATTHSSLLFAAPPVEVGVVDAQQDAAAAAAAARTAASVHASLRQMPTIQPAVPPPMAAAEAAAVEVVDSSSSSSDEEHDDGDDDQRRQRRRREAAATAEAVEAEEAEEGELLVVDADALPPALLAPLPSSPLSVAASKKRPAAASSSSAAPSSKRSRPASSVSADEAFRPYDYQSQQQQQQQHQPQYQPQQHHQRRQHHQHHQPRGSPRRDATGDVYSQWNGSMAQRTQGAGRGRGGWRR